MKIWGVKGIRKSGRFGRRQLEYPHLLTRPCRSERLARSFGFGREEECLADSAIKLGAFLG